MRPVATVKRQGFRGKGSGPSTVSLGKSAESEAEVFLRKQGYASIARNFRIRRGEIDLVMREGDTVCFVEVRSRKSRSHGTAAETVGGVKQSRLILAARNWLASSKWKGACRFDVVAIHGDDIELIRDAFRLS